MLFLCLSLLGWNIGWFTSYFLFSFCVFVALNISNINNDFSYPFFIFYFFYPLLQMHFTITPFDTSTNTATTTISSNIRNDIVFMIMAVLCCVYFLSKTPFIWQTPAKIKTLLSHIIICISWLSKNKYFPYKYLTP